MVTMSKRSKSEAQSDPVYDEKYPARRILRVIADKWTPIVLYCLRRGTRRFNPGASAEGITAYANSALQKHGYIYKFHSCDFIDSRKLEPLNSGMILPYTASTPCRSIWREEAGGRSKSMLRM